MRLGKDEAAPQGKGVSRRQFAAIGVAAAAAAGYSGSAHAALPVQENQISVNAGDGMAEALFAHPVEGQHPGVVLWSSPAGLTSSTAKLARELAGAGFAVLVVDPFVRGGRRLHALEQDHISADGQRFVAWLEAQSQVEAPKQGYVLRTIVPGSAALFGKGRGKAHHASYLIATPRGAKALSERHQAALDRAIQAKHQLAA